MSDLERRVRLGLAAATVLENEAWLAAVSAVDGVILEQFRSAKTAEIAWDARQRLRALGDVVGYLHAAMRDGEAARRQGESAAETERRMREEASQSDWLATYRERAREAWARADEPAPEVSTEQAQKELQDGDA